MRITRIDIEGRNGRYVTIARREGSRWIEVTTLTPYEPDGRDHKIPADIDEGKLWTWACNLQLALDGRIGTNGDIDGVYRELQRFTD